MVIKWATFLLQDDLLRRFEVWQFDDVGLQRGLKVRRFNEVSRKR